MTSKELNHFLNGFMKAAADSTAQPAQATPKPEAVPDKFGDPSIWKNLKHTERPVAPSTLEALKRQETGPGPAANAVGDHGAALGPLQQHQEFYQQATNYNPSLAYNQKLQAPYTYQDVTNYPYASAVAKSGLNASFPKHAPWNVSNLARVYNGGQGGLHNPATTNYANAVLAFKKYLTGHPGVHFPGAK